MPILSIEGLTISRLQHAIVKNVSFSIHKGNGLPCSAKAAAAKA
ncbi:hypothetical protein QKW52_20290 [Bacillus sonorensis]|nr:hypothetical protein [Bacillus sonorensis]